MSNRIAQDQHADRPKTKSTQLETVTATVLLLVLAALTWMVLVAYWPATFELASTELEVVIILILLTAGLALVSAVALVHTRPGPNQGS